MRERDWDYTTSRSVWSSRNFCPNSMSCGIKLGISRPSGKAGGSYSLYKIDSIANKNYTVVGKD